MVNKTSNRLIGVLTHLKRLRYTEKLIIKTIKEFGFKGKPVDPREIVIDEKGNFLKANRGSLTPINFAGVISRAEICEIRNKFDPTVIKSYWNFFQACHVKRIPTINGHPFLLETCQDKFFSYLLVSSILKKYEIYGPKTYLFSSRRIFESIAPNLKYPLVMKDPFGALGKRVTPIMNYKELVKWLKSAQFPTLCQEIIEKTNKDGCFQEIRVIASRNPVDENPIVAACVYRNHSNFTANLHKGAYYTLGREDKEDKDFSLCSLEIIEKMNADMIAVDFARDKNGKKIFFEINYSPGTSEQLIKLKGNIWKKVIELTVKRCQSKEQER